MPINTNGWTIYAPENTTTEELIEAFESNEELWSKATGPKGLGPRGWVLAHKPSNIVFTTGRNMELIKKHQKEWVSEKITCECGRTVTRGKLTRHKTTTIHLAALAANT